MSFFAELKRRKVIRVAVVYAATAFAVLQAADIMLPRMGVPEWAMGLLVAFVVFGLPIALVLGWALEVTPDGLKRTEATPAAQAEQGPAPALLGKRTVLAAAALVILGIGLGAGWFLRPLPAEQPAIERSIAVLPFTDLSPERDQEYFSDGLAEEILNLLAAVRDLSVASRTSAFSFKGSGLPIPEIAGRLGVNYVLEGSVRKADEQIRVTAQLIDARSDRHLWSGNFDRTLADVFAVQDEIAGAIGEALQVELLGAGGRQVTSETIDPEVYEQFLQARFLLRQRNDEAIAAAIAQLEAVVEAAPTFARALALLAEAYLLGNNPVADPRAEQRVEQALAVDPDLASAIMVRGYIANLRGNRLSAYTDYQRAIELAPEEPRPYHWIGILYTGMGYVERGEQAIARAAELEPGNANVRGWQSALLARRGAREEAVRAALQQARLGNPIGHLQAAIYLLDSDIERAAEQLRLAEAAGPAIAPPLRPLIRIARGETEQIEPFIRALQEGEVQPYFGTAGLLALDLDEALLQTLGDLYLDFFENVHALFWTDDNAPLRADPRFVRFMERVGAFPLWRELGPPPDCRADGDTFVCGLEGDA
jgi:TolB-like protein